MTEQEEFEFRRRREQELAAAASQPSQPSPLQSLPPLVQQFASMTPMGRVLGRAQQFLPAGLSAVNSAAFGLPELSARAVGGGQAVDQLRALDPNAAQMGEWAGMMNPARLGARAGSAAVQAIGRRLDPRSVQQASDTAAERLVNANLERYTNAVSRLDTRQGMARANPSPSNIRAAEKAQTELDQISQEIASVQRLARSEAAGSVLGRAARLTGQTAGGVMGLQLGAGMTQGARDPQQYGTGFQVGSRAAGDVISDNSITRAIPGVPGALRTMTGAVPTAGAAVGLGLDIAASRRESILDEAWRRALGMPPGSRP